MVHNYTSVLNKQITSLRLVTFFALLGLTTTSFAQDAPENVRAFPQDTQVRLTWDAVDGADRYRILRGTDENNITDELETVTTTDFIDTERENGSLFLYQILPIAPDDTEGTLSRIVAAVPRSATPEIDVLNLASFNGNNAIEVDTASLLNFATGQNFTIAMWVKADPTQSVQTPVGIITKRAGVPGPYPFAIEMNGTHGRVTFSRSDGTETASISSGKNINDGAFHYLVATKNGNDLSLFIDGVLQGTTADVTGETTNANSIPITIGNIFATGSGFLTGEIDELAIFDEGQSQENINTYLENPSVFTGDEANLVGLWHFDEPSGDIAYNSIGNLHPARLNGTALQASEAIPPILVVSQTIPRRSAIGVSADDNITVTFGVAIDNATVNDESIKVSTSVAGLAAVTPGAGTATATIAALPDLKSGEEVSVTVTGKVAGASDEKTEALWVTENFRFTTAATEGEGAFVDLGNSFGAATSNDVALADLNDDGIIDAIFANAGGIQLWTGDDEDNNGIGDGTFTNAASFGSSTSLGIAIAELNNEGSLDVFVANDGANQVWIGNGDGSFVLADGSGYGDATSNAVALGDLNGDGFVDAFVANATENKVWFNNTDGTFSDSGRTYGTGNSTDVSLGDVDADGDLDAVVANDGGGSQIYLNNGHGIFEEGPSIGSGSARGVTFANLNGDGFLDVVIANAEGASEVFLNQFAPAGPVSFDGGSSLGTADSRDVAAGDLDADGDIDLYEVNVGANKIWLNDGSGSFTENTENFGSATSLGVALGDLNDDGAIDAFVANGESEANKPWINGGCAVRDRVALVSLYNNTNGENWTDNTNWNGEEPLSSWFGVQVNNEGCVTSLELPNNALSGQIPTSFWKAINLRELDLSENSIVGTLSTEIKNLDLLEDLNLSNNILSGSIPIQIDSLNSINTINLSNNGFSGTLPEIPGEGNSANLQLLDLSNNNLEGAIPTTFGNLSALQFLNLSNNTFSGSIPTEFGSLAALDSLNLSNNALTGAIPQELTNLLNLKTLRLSNNNIDQIPETVDELSSLRLLYLDGNAITEIPAELGGLFSLRELSLSNNQLTDSVPDPIWQLTGLEYLALNGNELSGAIPSEVGLLTNLTYLHLGSNNFTGALPNELGNLLDLEFLSLADNNFSSSLPDALANLIRLRTLLINDNTFAGEGIGGAIPLTYAVSLTALETFDFRNTNVCEPVGNDTYTSWRTSIENFETNNNVCPACLEDNRVALTALYNSAGGTQWNNNTNWNSNRSLGEWFGVSTNSLGCVTELDLSKSNEAGTGVPGNNLRGTIPTEIEGLNDLEILNLSFNQLDSLLPESIGSGLTNLRILNVSNNQLDGEIPITISGIGGLEEAYFDENEFEGPLPNSISSLQELRVLSFSGNQITEIPTAVSGLDNIEIINGANNLLTEVPSELWLISTLRSLDISGNDIAGEIPSVLEEINLPNLNTLNLSANRFTNFPTTITQFPLIEELFLQENEIRDSIPVSIGQLNNLVRFDISDNRLLGGIPAEIGNLDLLQAFTVSRNDSLSGPLPLDMALLTAIDTFIFINTSLCEPDDETFAAWRDAVIDSGGIYIGTGLCPACINDDREALDDFFTSLQGENWRNTTDSLAIWQPDNPSSQVSAWFGVSVNNEGCVVGIDLSNSTGTGNDGNNLRGTIPPEIANITELQFLNLSNNDSLGGSLIPEIAQLSNLEELALNNIGLEGEIPDGIWNLENLDTLDLGNNFLEDTLSTEIVNLRNLVLLDLSKNSLLGELPREIGNLEQLTHFNLDSTGLVGEVPEEILNLDSLQFLDISDNAFTNIPNFTSLLNWGSLETEGLRIEDNLLTFGSIEPNIGLPDSIVFTYAPQDSIAVDPREYTIVEGASLNIIFETDGENNQYQWFKVDAVGDETSVSAISDTALFFIETTVLADSGFYYCQVTNTLATELTLPTQLIKVNVVPALTTLSPAETGVSPSPLLASSKDQAILGITAVSTGTVEITQLTFPTTSDPNGKFENVRLVRSTDSSFVSMEDNVVIEGATVDLGIGQIEITNFADTVSTDSVYYFLVVDIDSTVNFMTELIQLEFDQDDALVSLGSVADTSFTSFNYSFAALQEIIVLSNDSLIANNDTIPTLANGTDMGFAILGDTITQTFEIVNLGDTTLRLTDDAPFIDIQNDIDGLFSLVQVPDSSIIGGRDTLAFTIGFVAIDTMARDVTISIANNDTTATPYTFTLRGRGTVPPLLTFTGTTLGCEGDSLFLKADALDADAYIWKLGADTLSTDTTLVIPVLVDSVHTDSSYSLTLVKDTYTYTADTFAVLVSPFPVATFTGDPEFNTNPILCFGGELRLIADQKDADAYLWKRGEEEIGIDSILFLTEVEDTTRNDYTLTVIKNGCMVVSDSFTVRVRPTPLTSFQGDTIVCEGSTLQLVADEVDAISYTWMKGDSIISELNTLTIEAIADTLSGSNYSLKVNKAFCEDSTSFSILVKPLPTTDFFGETTVCQGQRLELIALQEEPDSVIWMRADSVILSTEATFALDTAGLADAGDDYSVMVINDSCSVIREFSIVVNPAPPVQIMGQDSVCALGQSYIYEAFTENNIYEWRVEGGEIIGGFDSTFVITSDTVMMDTTIVIEFDTTTTVDFSNRVEVVWYDSIPSGKVFLTETIPPSDTTAFCTLQDSLQTFITPFIQPRLLGIDQVCEFSQGVVYAAETNDNDYVWEVTGGTIVQGQNTSQIVVDWDSAGIGTVTLFEAPIAETYCPVAVTLEVELFSDPQVIINGPKAVCENATNVEYSSNTLNGVYTWRVIGGQIVSKPDSSTIFVDWGPSGVGSISLEQSFGTGQSCLADTTEQISINPIPEARIIGNRTTCIGAENVVYTAADTTGDLYFWRITGGVIEGELNGPQVSVRWQPAADSIRTGRVEMIQVIQYDSLGIECTDTDFIEINLDGQTPVAAFQQPAQTPAGIGVRFVDQSTGPDDLIQWSWDFGDGREGSSEQNPNHTYEAQGTYEVTMTVRDLKGCTNTTTQIVVVGPRRPDLEPLTVMNMITPNGDGQNDVLYITNIEQFPDNEVLVLNSWGTKVFSATGYSNDWTATWNNNLLPPGNYVCVVRVKFIDVEGNEATETIKESITILR